MLFPTATPFEYMKYDEKYTADLALKKLQVAYLEELSSSSDESETESNTSSSPTSPSKLKTFFGHKSKSVYRKMKKIRNFM